MALNIGLHGIVHAQDNGRVVIVRPSKNGGAAVEIEVGEELAQDYAFATGDVVEGKATALQVEDTLRTNTALSDECMEDSLAGEEERDEPGQARGHSAPSWIQTRTFATEKLTAITRINGLDLEEAEMRPAARRNRQPSERTTPSHLLPLTLSEYDATGRMLDFAAPLGQGCMGVIFGPHGGGLTRTLRSVVEGVYTNAPEMVILVLLLRARSEEITDWRRRFPRADIVVCPSPQSGASPEATLRIADLTLACAQRQTELGRHVLLAVDSLTGLWGTMLEAEGADAQTQADQSAARRRLREWVQKAGNFGGEGLLGGSLGGSLTLVGTVWNVTVEEEAEEERDVHPHLRLLEHILHETDWRVLLSAELSQKRLYPALETTRCLSLREEAFFSPALYARLTPARNRLRDFNPVARHLFLMDALDATTTLDELLIALFQE